MNGQKSKSKILEETIENGMIALEKHMASGGTINFDTSVQIGTIIKDITKYAHINGYYKHPAYLGRISTILIKDYSQISKK